MSLVNLEEFGRRVRAARILAGCDRVSEAVTLIHERSGVTVSERTLYAIEKGKQMPSLEQSLAITVGLRPPSGGVFFFPAFSEEIAGLLRLPDVPRHN